MNLKSVTRVVRSGCEISRRIAAMAARSPRRAACSSRCSALYSYSPPQSHWKSESINQRNDSRFLSPQRSHAVANPVESKGPPGRMWRIRSAMVKSRHPRLQMEAEGFGRAGERTALVAARMVQQHVALRLMEPRDHDQFVTGCHAQFSTKSTRVDQSFIKRVSTVTSVLLAVAR